MNKLLLEKREMERHLRVLHAIDESDIVQIMPPLPKYEAVKMNWTPTTIRAFAYQAVKGMMP